MKIRARIWGLCLGSASVLIILALASVYQMQQLIRTVERGAQQSALDHLQSLLSSERQAIESFVFSATWWDEMVAFIQTKETSFGDEYVRDELETYELDAGWVFDPDFKLVYSAKQASPHPVPALARRFALMKTAFSRNPFVHFFLHTPSGIYEVFGASIHPSTDKERKTDPKGYFIVTRRWDSKLTEELADLSQSALSLRPPFREFSEPEEGRPNCQVAIPLRNPAGQPVAILQASQNYGYLQTHQRLTNKYLILFVSAYVTLATALILGLYTWVLRPLKHISRCLKENSPAPIKKLLHYDEIREIEEKLAAYLLQAQELNKAIVAAESATQAKTQFLRNLSHELKTPLNGIFGAEQLLETTPLGENQSEYLEIIRNCGEDLHVLIDQLLTLARIECGTFELNLQPINMEALIAEVCLIGQKKAAECQISFTCIRDEAELPPILIGDPLRLKEMLTQLIGNAFKFTREGEIKLNVSTLSETGGEIRLLFSIADTGIGICTEDLNEMMGMFTQGDSSDTRQYEGLGIGLALVQAITAAMNGKISCKSALGKGSTFTLELPFRKVTA